ncbi:MAG: hypothetical protein AABX85_03255 [Nanoarchaeota archaeon]
MVFLDKMTPSQNKTKAQERFDKLHSVVNSTISQYPSYSIALIPKTLVKTPETLDTLLGFGASFESIAAREYLVLECITSDKLSFKSSREEAFAEAEKNPRIAIYREYFAD